MASLKEKIAPARPATRERILAAALEVFAGKGYHRALVDDIVRASGTSKGAVYHHFPTKEALFLALVDEFAQRLALAVATAISRRQGALAKVEGALVAALDTFAENARLARLILLEAVSLGAVYEAKRAEVHGRFASLIRDYLDEAVSEGSIASIDTRVATLAWLGAVNEVVVQWLHTGTPPLAESIASLTCSCARSASPPTSADDGAEVPGPDGADDGVALAPRFHFDPGAAEVWRPVGVVGGDLHERDLAGVVKRPVETRVRHLHGIQRQSCRGDGPDARERLVHAQLVASRMIQDVEDLALPHHSSHVLRERRVVELEPLEDEQPTVELGDGAAIFLPEEILVVLVIGDGQEVVASRLVLGQERAGVADSVGERRVGMQVAAQNGHRSYRLPRRRGILDPIASRRRARWISAAPASSRG
jgi:TetR/AcrR family fatty acid metabolism transcriptional regulator